MPSFLFGLLSLAFSMVMFMGCSVSAALKTHASPDLSGIGTGSGRVDVINRLGAPKFSDEDTQGRKQDVFEFVSGFHQLAKSRVLLYLAGDVVTLGLAELIFWPMEVALLGDAKCVATVVYDDQDKVDSLRYRKAQGLQDC